MRREGGMRFFFLLTGLFSLVVLSSRLVVPRTGESEPQLATTVRGGFEIRVNAIGVLDASRSHMISSKLRGDKGKIIYILDDGTEVKAGDIMVKLDPTPYEEEILRLTAEVKKYESAVRALEEVLEWEKSDLQKQVETARYNLKIEKLELDRIQKGEGTLQLAQLKEDMEEKEREYSRYAGYLKELQRLTDKGYSNPAEIEQASKKLNFYRSAYESAKRKYYSYREYVLPSLIETAKAKIERAETEIDQAKRKGVFKIAKAMAELEKARNELNVSRVRLAQAEKELENTTIRAPFGGIAILYETFRNGQKRKPRVGDVVFQNQPLLYLPDISSMIVKTRVRERDLYKVSTNQEVDIKIDAYPDISFKGVVTSIGVLAERSGGEKYFQVNISVKGNDPRLRPGMTARVSIMTDRVIGRLVIPLQAIFDEAGRKYCYVYDKRGFRKVEVTPGRQNEDLVEVISGLKEGDRVSLIKPRAIL
jgi:HlyD family secretion protein